MLPKNKLISQFYKNLFYNRDVVLKGKKFPLTIKNNLRFYKVGHLLFIEQNPKKKTRWAALARKGAKILWVIDVIKNKYLYQVLNGKVIKLY